MNSVRSDLAASPTADTGSCAECALYPLTFYGPLTTPEQAARLRRRRTTFPAKALVLQAGSIADTLFAINRGWMFRFTLMPDGRRQILSFHVPGDLLPHQAIARHPLPFSVQSLTPVSACVFDVREFSAWIQAAPGRSAAFNDLWARESMQLDERLVDLGRRSATERIDRLILQLAARAQPGASAFDIEFPLRQEHIADALGLTVEYVSRTLSRMQADGALRLVGRRLQIPDPSSLNAMAGTQTPTGAIQAI
mgnify:CR=1 FL=1